MDTDLAAALPLPLAPLDLAALNAQQHRYLAALQAGASLLDARKRAGGPLSQGISADTVNGWLATSIPFARAHDAVHAGLAVLGVPASREIAAAAMPDLVGHWLDKAYHADRDRDQATFGQLVGQTSQAIGQGAQAAARVDVRISIATTGAAAPLTTIDAIIEPAPDALPIPDDAELPP